MSSPNTFSNPDVWNHTWHTTAIIVTVCSALSLYNSLELILLIFITFKEWRGLYFWSLLIATFGIIPYCVGFIIEYFQLTHPAIGKVIDSYGWVTLITGQAFVLYSRLNLVLGNQRVLTAVKWMIIIDALIFHTSTTVVLFGAHYGSHQYRFSLAYKYMEKVQMTAFCIQEFILSGLYVYKTVSLLKIVKKAGTRRVMWQLFTINVIIIAMDIGLLAIEYRDLHVMEQTFKSFIYSVKLKLEFAILGKLVELVQSNSQTLHSTLADAETYVDLSRSRTVSDVTRMPSANTNMTMTSRAKRANSQHQHALSWPMVSLAEDNNSEKLPPISSVVQRVETAPPAPTSFFPSGQNQQGPRSAGVAGLDEDEIDSVESSFHSAAGMVMRRKRSDSDLLYAEAMRSISLS